MLTGPGSDPKTEDKAWDLEEVNKANIVQMANSSRPDNYSDPDPEKDSSIVRESEKTGISSFERRNKTSLISIL